MKEKGFTLAKARNRRYPARTITDGDYADDIALLANTPALAESLLHSVEWVAGGIGFHVNTDKTDFMCFNQRSDISTLNDSSLKLADGCVNTTVWMHHMDDDRAYGEKA